jgi:glucan phosphoethanolaminetransferase (alkaline phosphatase superfamily)
MLKKIYRDRNKNWLLSLFLVVALSLVGWGVSMLISSLIPFWLLLGFSVIYSIEKWLFYYTRKYKIVGKIYRAILNLSVLSLLGLLVWSGVSLFTQQFMQSPIVGSLVFLAELVAFIWACKVVSRNSWRQPSMKLTVLSVICLFLIFAFAGVKPFTDYKDTSIDKITGFINEQQIKAEERKVAEENRRAAEKAEMDAAGVVDEYDFYKDYVVLYNKFRSENGRQPLVFDAALNELAAQRAIEISQPGNFSHEGIEKYNLGENIAMMAYSSDSASDLIELWASSPGHRSNMLMSSYHRTGFAKNGKYAVQIFD